VEVGPFRIEILEPLKTLRVVLAPNDTGISADLRWIPRTSSFAEGHQRSRRRRGTMEATRFNQFGYWQGEIRYAGHSVAVDPKRVFGTKDRSWGIRPVGDPDTGGAPPSAREADGIFFLWAPLHWPTRCTHAGIFEHGDGVRWHWDGTIVPVYDDPEKIPLLDDPGVTPTTGSWCLSRAPFLWGGLTEQPLSDLEDPLVPLTPQWLVGDAILAAPVLDESGRRRVYLPAGGWTDWWTGARTEGPRWLEVEVDLAAIPLWLREGAVVPLGPVTDHVDQRPLEALTLRIAPFRGDGERALEVPTAEGVLRVAYRAAGGRHTLTASPGVHWEREAVGPGGPSIELRRA
jgi:hypothetical protein